MNTLDKFRTKTGLLTRYAFCCGYVEQYEKDNNNRLTLSKEPNDYHVKGFVNAVHVWEVFDTAALARMFIKSHKLPRKGA